MPATGAPRVSGGAMGPSSASRDATCFASCSAEPLLAFGAFLPPPSIGREQQPSFLLEPSRGRLLLRTRSCRASLLQPAGWLSQLAGSAQSGLRGLQAQLQGLAAPHGSISAAFASLTVQTQPAKGDRSPTCSHDHDLRKLFAEIDRQRVGYLDAHTMRVALSRLGLPCGKDYLDSLMQQYDANHDGKIQFEEFAAYVERRQQDMAKAFDSLDADTSGRHLGAIDTHTLVRVLRKAGLPAREEDAAHMISMLDDDHDGRINYQEFVRFTCLLPAAQVNHGQVLFDWVDSSDWLTTVEYRLSMIPPKSTYQRLVAGGIAGAVSRTCVAPFERLRTILMTDASVTPLQAVRRIHAQHGLRGFWKGNTLTVIKTMPQSAIQFMAYDGTKELLSALFPRKDGKGLSQLEKMLAGCTAGATSILLTYPLEVMRTRAAIAGGASSIPGAVRQIWGLQGLSGFYQGLKCGVLCETLSTGLGFYAYELGQAAYRRLHEGASPGPRDRGLIGGVSALFVMAATMPLEVCLRRLQAQGHPGRPVLYRNARHCFATIVEQEGWRALYRGLLSSFLKVGPSIGVTYALYALLVQSWGIGGLRAFSHLDRKQESALQAGA